MTIDHSTEYNDKNTKVLKYANLFYNESGSATKRIDYIKMEVKNEKFGIAFGNGLNKKTKGKSPLERNLKYVLNGDKDDIYINE